MPGLAARRLASHLVDAVLAKGRALDDALAAEASSGLFADLSSRDRAFAHLIAATVLRRHGSLVTVLDRFITRPLPEEAWRARTILLIGAAQILALATPPHAAINLAVEQCRRDPEARRFDKLTNAVLRRVASDGITIFADLDWPRIDIPAWLWARWTATYGVDLGLHIAAASLIEAPLDLTVKNPAEAPALAARLGGLLLPTGSIRLAQHGRIEDLAGFDDGAWWVQDAAAALPVRLFGEVRGKSVADLCAAPGGKTAALAAAGAKVTAVDTSASRIRRLSANLQRLGLSESVELLVADVLDWSPPRLFDAVLLDAPCTATGTIRRHPDILHLKRPGDVLRLAEVQAALLAAAARLVKPGGTLVFCTCSLEPEEGPGQIDRFLASMQPDAPAFSRLAVDPGTFGIGAGWITPEGDLRTLPCHIPEEGSDGRDGAARSSGGMDGFFASRLLRAL